MTVIRHFRQVVLWPLQLMPLKPGAPVQRHWEALEQLGEGNPWREVREEFGADPQGFRERHYKHFITFLPYVQVSARRERGPGGRAGTARDEAKCSARTYSARGWCTTTRPPRFHVPHVDLYFS